MQQQTTSVRGALQPDQPEKSQFYAVSADAIADNYIRRSGRYTTQSARQSRWREKYGKINHFQANAHPLGNYRCIRGADKSILHCFDERLVGLMGRSHRAGWPSFTPSFTLSGNRLIDFNQCSWRRYRQIHQAVEKCILRLLWMLEGVGNYVAYL